MHTAVGTTELPLIYVQHVSADPAIIKELQGLHMILWEQCVH
jgi:hypothetical protein